jgi:hypothetical protein
MPYVDDPNLDPDTHERRVALDRAYHTIMNEFRSGKYTDETLPAVLREKYKEIKRRVKEEKKITKAYEYFTSITLRTKK